jgi:mannosyltransferase
MINLLSEKKTESITTSWITISLLLATILRLPTLGHNSLWSDEAISYLAAKLPVSEILNNTVQSSHPPFHYLLLHFWLQLAPDSDTAVRLLDLLWNLLLIPAIYLLTVALLKDRRLGLVAAALVAISPFHLLYSHELRMYALLMLLTTLCAWAYIQAREKDEPKWWGLFALLAFLALYTHLFTLFFLTAVGLHAVIYHQQRRALHNTIGVGLLLALLFVPWLLVLSAEAEAGMGSMRPLLADREMAADPLRWLTTPAFLIFGPAFRVWHTAVVLFLTLTLLIILPLELRKAGREQPLRWAALPLLPILLILGAPLLLYYARPFFLPERTMAAASPFMMILLAWGVTRRHSPLPLLVGATAVTMLIGSWLYLTGPPVKPPYRAVVQHVVQHRLEGDIVLHTSDGSYLPALRYANIPNHLLLAGDPQPRKPLPVYQAFGGEVWDREQVEIFADRLWLIVALEHSIEWQQEQAQYFADHYRLLERHDFGGVAVFLYQAAVHFP